MGDFPLWTQQPLIRFRTAADILAVSMPTLRHLVEEGKLDTVQTGGRQRQHRRIVTASLLKYLSCAFLDEIKKI